MFRGTTISIRSSRTPGMLAHLLIWNGAHFRHVLTEYLDYHNRRSPHQSLAQDTPAGLPLFGLKERFTVGTYLATSSTTIGVKLPRSISPQTLFLKGHGEISSQIDF